MGIYQQKKFRNRATGLSRRRFVTSALAGGIALGLGSGLARSQPNTALRQQAEVLSGQRFNLNIGYEPVNFTGTEALATTINGSLPAPVLHWREGDEVVLNVNNNLAVDSSIHWHGIILPSNMDGVPGMSFAGIRPGESYEYRFRVNQSGTFWYHSHSGFQEQTGMYGPIIIDPLEAEPFDYQRDYVVLLSDWSDTEPESIYATLKKQSHYYNFNERTIGDLFGDIREKGLAQTWQDRAMWNQMRMSDRDIADVTGYTYTYLMNGNTPDPGWQGLFSRGEKVRLRFINASAMTIFDVRIPGLQMTVVAADGQNIEPVSVDEFRIGVAETYDVIVEPDADDAYAVFAQSIDRSGYAFGSLSPDVSVIARVPAMDPAPVLGMADMGMSMADMDMPGMEMPGMEMNGMQEQGNTSGMEMQHEHHPGMEMPMSDGAMNMEGDMHMNHDMNHDMEMNHDMHMNHDMNMDQSMMNGRAGYGSEQPIHHHASEFGPQVDMRSESPQNGLDDPGIGLRNHQGLYNRRVLTYADIKNLYQTIDQREPEREIQLHLTGNMHRYMWSMNGIPFADAEPLQMAYGERLRITLVNDTMMTHPIHLHGLWSELETGEPGKIPRKHTVIVQPGKKISYLVTADARGNWAYHCHLLYHMMGMFREVVVS
ncbi:MAG: copper oxidase [Gammaproteobacteria bacterium]|nr:copper oxidase [Gammaproteobacteria bacterium]|tara:strand:+ start:181428 stop:183386 length:1959 start_codon:yes stop_codon:yes gene_type:complete